MGWGRLLLLGNLGQQFDIHDAQKALAQAEVDVARLKEGEDSVNKRLLRLQLENDELKLYLAATVRLLTQKGLVSRAELHAIVTAVDGSDGNLDGRYTGKVEPD
ncbi:MAG TPA: hypothetical protein VM029_03155 [Opitutaceae bacterium]|nr:hypothetical protein [Opitutaceae bacterium]